MHSLEVLTQQMAMVSAKKKKYYFFHKIPSRYQCMFEAAISTVYILMLHTYDNALAYWLKPFTHSSTNNP